MMKVVILHQTIAKHDAIGNDIYQMYKIINKKFECYVYCDFLIGFEVNRIDEDQLFDIIKDRNNLVIYHHSVFWKSGEEILGRCNAKLLIKYHNITPPEFFVQYNEEYLFQCAKGREQTIRLYKRHKNALWVCDSVYNTYDIPFDDNYKKVILPPFNNIEGWNNVKPDELLLKNLIESKNINLLFVGRVAPNKGHKYLITIIKDFVEHYSNNICLHIIGKKDTELYKYNAELDIIIKRYKLENEVKFIGEINDQTLISYYLGCDFFLCCSEHEGFCVPLLEAQYLNLPVIALRSSAVAETLGDNQIILNDSVQEYSAAIKILSEETRLKDFIVKKGIKNYHERFSYNKLIGCFRQIISEFTGEEI